MKWTPEKVDELRRLAAEGLGAQRNAEQMGTTRRALSVKASLLRISLRAGSAEYLAGLAESEVRRVAELRGRWRAALPGMKERLRAEVLSDAA